MDDLEIEFPRPCSEKWDAMRPIGDARHCARCDKVIHDLSQYTAAEAEALLQSGEEVCVRAKIEQDGAVQLKPTRGGLSRRMIASFAASVALVASGPALASDKQPEGRIKGHVAYVAAGTQVRVSDGEGRIFIAKVGRDGRYKIKHVPPGHYDLAVVESDDQQWSAGTVVVETGKTSIVNPTNPNVEEIVGVFSRRR